jgi:hypothetical protein
MFHSEWTKSRQSSQSGVVMTGGPAGELSWQRATCEGGACLEIATLNELVMVRTSMDPDTIVRVSRGEWRQFLISAKDGLFDEL